MESNHNRNIGAAPIICGIILILAGLLSMMITVSEWGPGPGDLAIDWVFIPMFLLTGTFLVFAFFIASGHRLADKAPFVITASLILMIPFSYLGTPDTTDFLGSARAWAVIMGLCQTIVCGGISFIPMLFSGSDSQQVALE